eukprot:1195405-Prorocentrum_minimum.AAC.3
MRGGGLTGWRRPPAACWHRQRGGARGTRRSGRTRSRSRRHLARRIPARQLACPARPRRRPSGRTGPEGVRGTHDAARSSPGAAPAGGTLRKGGEEGTLKGEAGGP